MEKVVTLIFAIISLSVTENPIFGNEDELRKWLSDVYEVNASAICYESNIAEWNFNTDVSNATKQEISLNQTLRDADSEKYFWTNYFSKLNVDDYKSEDIRRQIKFQKILGDSALDEGDLRTLTDITNNMTNIYGAAKICPYSKQDCDLEKDGLSLEPSIEDIISTSDNYDELTYAWSAWRNATGKKMKSMYRRYVELKNKAAVKNGFTNAGELWRDDFETENFIEKVDKLWLQVEPLYSQLHKYAAKKLKEKYGDKIDLSDGLIPANVLGNMWAQSWENIELLLKPFDNASAINVTNALISDGYTPKKMFETSNEFYTSLGLPDSSMCYDSNSMIEKPERDVLCHASAWDFCNGKDFRIKMCTKVDMDDFLTIHHEMGHIQYYLLYKNQPVTFRNGANPGFHEAIGDTIALSVATPEHLQKIGLLKAYDDSEEASINMLMGMALQKVSFLPYGLLIDKWRWDVFNGTVPYERWNEHWWDYRKKYQKIKAPIERSEDDFDPGAKYHVAGDSQYISYFIAHILEFQLYKGLCVAAGEYDTTNKEKKPLHKCDFYKSKEAGKKLMAGLNLGRSKHWSVALKAMTGEEDLDASALLEYFDPLYKFLQKENGRLSEGELGNLMGEWEKKASKLFVESQLANWNLQTDLNNKNAEKRKLAATLASSEFRKKYWEDYFRYLNESDYKNETLRRQVKLLKWIGIPALEEDKLTELIKTIDEMSNIYSTAKLCPYKKHNCNKTKEGLSLIELGGILAQSSNYEELLYIWKAWRDGTGAKIRNLYRNYVKLTNEAARLNNFKDYGEMWRSDYEMPTLIEDVDKLWEKIKPLYDNLHLYVRNKLKKRYAEYLLSDGLIPANILGDTMALTWVNIGNFVAPYPNSKGIDLTLALKRQNYTVLKLFETSNDFYLSLGLEDASISYNTSAGAMIEKPRERDVVCHPSAWNFYDRKNFRIKACTGMNYGNLKTIYHEMGHIEYDILYKNQPIVFMAATNPAFHEAIGDTVKLSATSMKHLKKIGLLKDSTDDKGTAINNLMGMALEVIPILPFAIIMDKWRWDVFSGNVTDDKWNERWWYYRGTYQKLKPPIPRSEDDLDPAALYHVPNNNQYINYFLAKILEFQLYRSMCIEAGEYDPKTKTPPLHECDFYNSKDAGKKLRAGLELGASRHWKDVLEIITGQRDLDSSAMLEYFEPLNEFLNKENAQATGGGIKLNSSFISILFVCFVLIFLK